MPRGYAKRRGTGSVADSPLEQSGFEL